MKKGTNLLTICYFGGYKVINLFPKFATGLYRLFYLLVNIFEGLCLGILSKKNIYKISEAFYKKQKFYFTEEHNKKGLFLWEKYILEKFFTGRKNLLLLAAGGGREIYTLSKMDYLIEAYECNNELLKFANSFLEREKIFTKVKFVEPDSCPKSNKLFDGVIISWGAYSHIKGRLNRIKLLKSLKKQLKNDSPLLISFWVASKNNFNMRLLAKIANTLKSKSEEKIEVGDRLPAHFTHSFTQQEIESELSESGYKIAYYSTEMYGHAVGVS